jgi:ABC-type dipeptide/oligopeptide/nickel transport system permease component
MNDIGRFCLRRIPLMLASMWGVITVTFMLVALVPSDPARAVAGTFATKAEIAQISKNLGLEHSLWTRYVNYWNGLFHGSLGQSIYSPTSVMSQIGQLLPSTLELVILSMFFGGILGIGLGAVSAYYHRRWQDRVSSTVVGVMQALPDFVLGVLVIYLFAYLLRILPGPEGQLSLVATPPPTVTHMILVDSLISGQFGTFWDAVQHAILPVVTLSIVISAVFARITRAAMRDAMDSEQTSFARACGLPERQVVRYALLSSRTPIMTYAAVIFGALFGGTAIVETIFNWNGLSQWAVQAMLKNDYPEIQGFVLVVGVITLFVYFLLDLGTGILDPRVRLTGGRT